MKLKYYLRGLGTGILFATIVLFIVYSFNMTDSKIREKAEKLGMVQATMDITAEKNEESTSSDNKTENIQTSDNKGENNSTEVINDTTEVKSEYILTVSSGSVSLDIAKDLQSHGIINDYKEFNNFLCDNGYDGKIHTGNFKVSSDMSFEEIASLLIN